MKKKLCILAMTVFMLTCAACGGNLETTVNLNSDLSGTREMKYTIDKAEYDEYVTGDITAVDATITEHVPEVLTYTMTEDQSNYIATFTMEFESPEDAAAKISQIMSDGTEYTVDATVSDSVFCNGFYYSESVGTESLMGWFEDLMVNSGYVASGDSSYIIENSSAKVVLEDVTKDAGYYNIDVSSMEYVTIEEIRMFTEANPDGTFNRTVELDITDVNLSINSEEIEAFMDESVPEGATGEWKNEMGLNTHTVTMEKLSAEGLQAAMTTYTHTEECVFTEGEVAEGEEQVLFSENLGFVEHLNMSQYGCNSDGTVEVLYYVRNDKAEGTLNYSWSDVDGEPVYEQYYGYYDDNYPEYCQYDFYRVNKIDLKYEAPYYYAFEGGSWDTTVKNANEMTRAITLVFADDISEEHAATLAGEISAMGTSAEGKSNIVAEVVDVDGSTGICIKLSGNASAIEEAMNTLTGQDDASVSYDEENVMLGLKKACSFKEDVNFDGLIYMEEGGQNWAIEFDYSVAMPGTILEDELRGEMEYDEDAEKAVCTVLTSEEASLGAESEKFNIVAIVIVVILVLIVVVLVVVILLVAIGSSKKKKQAKASAAQQAPVMQQAPIMQQAPVMQQAAPIMQPTPVVEQPAPVAEEAPATEEAPAVEEAPATEEAPVAEEAPATEETSAE